MALIVKIMSGESAPDDDTRKGYSLHTGVTDVEFAREANAVPIVWITYQDSDAGMPEKRYPAGNVYVMNEAGKTVSSFGWSPLDERFAGGPVAA